MEEGSITEELYFMSWLQEHASIPQDCANKLIFESALGSHDPTRHLALSALYLGEMAKAIMDDVARSLETPA